MSTVVEPLTPPQPSRLPDQLTPSGSLADGLDDELDWVGIELSGDFTASRAAGLVLTEASVGASRFAGADLSRARLTDVRLVGCDLQGAILDEAVLTRVELVDCRLSGVVLSRARLHDVRIVDSQLDEANLRMITSRRLWFERCSMTSADLYEAGIEGAVLAGCDLSGATFAKARATGARLHGSRLDGIGGADCLRGASFGSDQIVELAGPVFAALGLVIDDELAPDRDASLG
ncbi:MAG: pentapeptide repeat-containing protein [Acidimicrobiales bacterium]